ncbi:hypothetical protein JKF63_07805 [Porcisia hertigi]|uniref:Enkurin domain-containing protein n=1 Tax=Porcisia hertigi TaxID=2761500 RepID=A0A837A9C0_9TRYP|nr:hypothetical protein JKF63_07805 [Porcisia hertigi]
MPQNAAQLNRMQIREQEALNRQRRIQDEEVARRGAELVRRTQSQYKHVASHGYGRADGGEDGLASGGFTSSNSNEGAHDEVQIRVYVRECDEGSSQTFCYKETTGSAARRSVSGTLPAIGSPGRTGALRAAGAGQASGGAGGGSLAGISSSAASAKADAPNRARIPRYLQQRKAELVAEKEAIAAETERQRQLSLIPAGQRRVSEEEKEDTLRQLDARQQELEGQLARIPIRYDTRSILQRRSAIESELRQIEAKRNQYSTKGILYVPLC